MKSRHIAAALFWFPATVLAGAPFEIEWNEELALEEDRSEYERLLLDIVQDSLDRVVRGLNRELRSTLKIRVHTKTQYEARFGTTAAFGRAAHYSGGAIYVNGGTRLQGRFAALMTHEMVHAVLDNNRRARTLPTWLNEGTAELFQWAQRGVASLQPNQAEDLKDAARRGYLLPLRVRGTLSRLGYLESFGAVLFIQDNKGTAGLQQLLSAVLEGGGIESGLQDLGFSSVGRFEKAFSKWIERR